MTDTGRAEQVREKLRTAARFGTSPAGLLIGLLCGLLGFGLAVQVHSQTATGGLATARQSDLVRILDDVSSREQRLRGQVAALQATRSRLASGGDRAAAALTEARSRASSLGILAGTLPAQGPGLDLTITDPRSRVDPDTLLDAVQELRAAGAETIEVNDVRIGLSSAWTGSAGGVSLDGKSLTAPYNVVAIGDPSTLAAAMNIPGGVADTVHQQGGLVSSIQRDHVVVSALRPISRLHYAAPTGGH
jgi:uncharacterized protein YlxW (UPF0749 family)